LEPDDFTRCLEVVSAITLYGHEFLQKVGNELDLFKCFCKWLHSSIDQLVATVAVDDKAPEDPQVDTLKIAEYVGTHLRESSLLQFFKKDTMPRLSEYKARGENITELYAHKEKSAKAPGFMELAEYLDKLCATVFSKPQQSMRQQLRISRPVVISEQNVRKVDMRMANGVEGHPSAHILVCGGGAFCKCNPTAV
jgi:anaphase-promoting complex subunit 4